MDFLNLWRLKDENFLFFFAGIFEVVRGTEADPNVLPSHRSWVVLLWFIEYDSNLEFSRKTVVGARNLEHIIRCDACRTEASKLNLSHVRVCVMCQNNRHSHVKCEQAAN